jgi:BirA family biotin operon repressor/biotin-[acetyl-CoA-carboxylase] ligase
MTLPHDGTLDAVALASALGLPRVVLFGTVASTMDEAHRLAQDGANAGTVVIADEQTAGRGRAGRRWESPSGRGVWLTLLERPGTDSGLDVLSLRAGLHVAPVLEAFVQEPVSVKWPNDLYVGRCKVSGMLVEARWRDQRPDWVALGIGVNLSPPEGVPNATGVGAQVSRTELILGIVPALRAAAAARGPLTGDELEAFAARDAARGRRCARPAAGIVHGIDADGALVIESGGGLEHFRAGSLEFAEEVS